VISLADCGCSRRCTCTVTAGPGVTVDGNGSPSHPYVISAGAAATPTTACGLTGDGSTTTPLAAAVGVWPYACDVDAAASSVYCDSTGALRGDPPTRTAFMQNTLAQSFPAAPLVPVPETTVATLDLQLTNPDPCRDALVILFQEADVDFSYPPDSEGGMGIAGDDMVHFANTGSSSILREHVQVNKLINLTLAPGETRTHTMGVTLSRGAGGSYYTRIQGTLRAWVISNPT
jgi:hypothetical protein